MCGICGILKPFKFLILLIVNVNQLINSFVLFVVGITVRYTNVFNDFLEGKGIENPIQGLQEKLPPKSPVALPAKSEFDRVSLAPLLKHLGTFMILLGFVGFAMSFFGIAVAINMRGIMRCLPKKHEYWMVLWLLFAIASGVIATSALCGVFWRRMVIETFLLKLLPDFSGLKGEDEPTMIFNTIMIGFQCCGVSGYSDFDKSTKWPPKSIDFKLTLPIKLEDNEQKYLTPIACCKNSSHIAYGCFMREIANDQNNYMGNGCLEALSEVAGPVMTAAMGVIIWIFLTSLLSIAASLLFFFAGPASESPPKRGSSKKEIKQEPKKQEPKKPEPKQPEPKQPEKRSETTTSTNYTTTTGEISTIKSPSHSRAASERELQRISQEKRRSSQFEQELETIWSKERLTEIGKNSQSNESIREGKRGRVSD